MGWLAGGKLPAAFGTSDTESYSCSTSHLIAAAAFAGSGWALVTWFGVTSLHCVVLDAGQGGAELGDPVAPIGGGFAAVGLDHGGDRLAIYGGEDYLADSYTVRNSTENLTAEQRADLPPEWTATGDPTTSRARLIESICPNGLACRKSGKAPSVRFGVRVRDIEPAPFGRLAVILSHPAVS